MNKKLAILGGEIRETVAANTLIRAGYDISVYGITKDKLMDSDVHCATLEAALDGADVVILPVKGLSEEGFLHAPNLPEKVQITRKEFQILSPKTIIFTGVASQYLKNLGKELNIKVIPLMELDPIAIPNALPTAEGALAIAIEESPYTVKGSRVLILGYGRVGKATAHIFQSVGAKVSLCVRNSNEIKEALQVGYDVRRYSGLTRVLPRTDVIINTVPALILTDEILAHVPENAVIIDLASLPGGVNFAAARQRNIKAIHSLGLPGKCAPITAGEILATGIIKILTEEGV